MALLSLLALASVHCHEKRDGSGQPTVVNFDLPPASGLGFTKAENLKNDKVFRLREAILKVIVPAGAALPVSSVLKDQSSTLEEAYRHLKAKGSRATVVDDLLALQIHRCLILQNENCLVRTSFVQMSAFVIDNGKEIITSFQAVSRSLQNTLNSAQIAQLNSNTVKLADLDFLAYDTSNLVVINELAPTHLQKISAHAIAILQSPEQNSAAVDDLSVLTLHTSLSASLGAAASAPLMNETVYVAGYPALTVDRAALGAGDSDGRNVFFSHGYVDAISVAYEALGLDWQGLPDETKILLNATSLALRVDATPEMIGGPILNERGEYVGMLTSTSTDLNKKYSFAVSAQNL